MSIEDETQAAQAMSKADAEAIVMKAPLDAFVYVDSLNTLKEIKKYHTLPRQLPYGDENKCTLLMYNQPKGKGGTVRGTVSQIIEVNPRRINFCLEVRVSAYDIEQSGLYIAPAKEFIPVIVKHDYHLWKK